MARTRALLVSLSIFLLVVGSLFVFNACDRGTTGSTEPQKSSELATLQEARMSSNEATNVEVDTDITMPPATGAGQQEKELKEPTSVKITLGDGTGVVASSTNNILSNASGMPDNLQTPEGPHLTKPEATSNGIQQEASMTAGAPTQPTPKPEKEHESSSEGVPVEKSQKEPEDRNVNSQASQGVSRFRFSKDDFPLNTLPVGPDEKVILITIDDGPGEYTMELLDLLKKENVKVVFFLNGDTVPWYKNVVRREFEEGHTIGTHTYCHRSYYQLEKRASKEELIQTLRKDIVRTEENIKAILPDLKIKLLRMPEGYYRKWMEPLIDEFGYICINWTAGFDWLTDPDEKVIGYYKKALRPGGIYLFHDGRYRGKRTIKILSEFIPYARAQGYRIVDPKEIFGN